MNKKLLIALPLLGAIMFSGCATIVSGTKQQVNIASNPTNKEITIGTHTVRTPALIEIEKGEDFIVKSEDCNQKTLPKQINLWFFGNILSAGFLGSTTDYASGAMWKYDENIQIDCRQ